MQRIYLKVPFAEKNTAKSLGAHWDPNTKRWYVVDRISFRKCLRWHPWPISQELKVWLDDHTSNKRYQVAMEQFNAEQKKMLRVATEEDPHGAYHGKALSTEDPRPLPRRREASTRP